MTLTVPLRHDPKRTRPPGGEPMEVQRSRRRIRRVVEPFDAGDRGHRSHAGAVHDRVDVAAACGDTVEGTPEDPFAPNLHAARGPAGVHAVEDRAPRRKTAERFVAAGVEAARPDDQGLVVPLHADGGAELLPAPEQPFIQRNAEARFRVEPRRAGDDVDAPFHERIREREVLAVADERGPGEPRIGVIAAQRQAERRAVASAANAQQAAARPEHLLDVDLHGTEPSVVRIRGG